MSRAICIIDTTVFCEILDVPNLAENTAEIHGELQRKLDDDEYLLIPITTIIETGNHIGQNGNGAQRRRAAERFVKLVKDALRGYSPFTPTPLQDQEVLVGWLDTFPDWVHRTDSKGKGCGFGDLTICEIWKEQCEKNQARRVYIWSNDRQLQGYNRLAKI